MPPSKKSAFFGGDYTNLEILPNGDLKIWLTYDGRDELNEMSKSPNLDTASMLLRLIEHHLCNGWDLVDSLDVGGLTDAPILSNDVDRDGPHGEVSRVGNIWWFPNYQVESEIDILRQNGSVIFSAGPENRRLSSCACRISIPPYGASNRFIFCAEHYGTYSEALTLIDEVFNGA